MVGVVADQNWLTDCRSSSSSSSSSSAFPLSTAKNGFVQLRDTFVVVASVVVYCIVWPVNHRWAMCVFTLSLTHSTAKRLRERDSLLRRQSINQHASACRLQLILLIAHIVCDWLVWGRSFFPCSDKHTVCSLLFYLLFSCHTWCTTTCTSKEGHKEAKFWLFTTAMLRLPPTTTLAVKWRLDWRILPLHCSFLKVAHFNSLLSS